MSLSDDIKQATDVTRRVLMRSDWFDGRQVDTTEYERFLIEKGFTISDKVREFLCSFGGLNLSFQDEVAKRYGYFNELNLDVLTANAFISENVECVENLVGMRLCPVGETDESFALVLMAADGRVFVSYQNYLAFGGDSGVQAIDALVSGKELPAV